MADWEWSESLKRYRNPATGKILSAATVAQLRDRFVDQRLPSAAVLAERVVSEAITVQQWVDGMRAEIKRVTLAEYALGRGGVNAMTSRDNGIVGNLCKAQYKYLQEFAKAVAAGGMSEAQIRARAQLYIRSATSANARGYAGAFGLRLTQLPGDGQTVCLTNCRCELSIEEDEQEWRIWWVVRHDAENCEDCLRMGEAWKPLTISKEQA